MPLNTLSTCPGTKPNLEGLAKQAQLLQTKASIEQQLQPGAALRLSQHAIELLYERRVVPLLQVRRQGAGILARRHVRLKMIACSDAATT